MKLKNLSIRIKLILLLTGLVGSIILVILFIIGSTLKSDIKVQVKEDFKKTQYYFKKQGSLIYDRLIESCLLIGENASFKANVDLKDPNSVMEAVKEFANYTKTDLMIVTDAEGRVLAWLDEEDKVWLDLIEWEGINQAVNGIDPEQDMEWPILWEVENILYQVVSVPIIAGESVLGSVTLGIRFTIHEAEDLKGESNVEISMFLKDELFASTIRDEEVPNYKEILDQIIIDKKESVSYAIDRIEASDPFEINIKDRSAYAYVSPLGKGVSAYYLATVWENEEMSLLNLLLSKIVWIGLTSFLLSTLLAFFISKKTTKPVLDLAEGMRKVKEGDFQVHLETSRNDELGMVTKSFNDMIQVLKERMFMKKYIGEHTFNMIQDDDSDHSISRGKLMEVSVLFSDIREFTKYCETKNPEAIITMLNEYLGLQAELVRQHGGFVDKYVGDEMMAIFTGDDSFEIALRCAQDIQRKLVLVNKEAKEPLGIGIGINKGEVVMGSIGNEDRMDYTVIGPTVNLGARMCSRAKSGEVLFRADLKNDDSLLSMEMRFKGISEELNVAVWQI